MFDAIWPLSSNGPKNNDKDCHERLFWLYCQGQWTFDPFRQLEMNPPIRYSEKASVFLVLSARLTPGSCDDLKNAPGAFAKKQRPVFSLLKREESGKNTCYSTESVAALVVPPFVGTGAMRSFIRYDFPLMVKTSAWCNKRSSSAVAKTSSFMSFPHWAKLVLLVRIVAPCS